MTGKLSCRTQILNFSEEGYEKYEKIVELTRRNEESFQLLPLFDKAGKLTLETPGLRPACRKESYW